MTAKKTKFLFDKDFVGFTDDDDIPAVVSDFVDDDIEKLDLPVLNSSGVNDFKNNAANTFVSFGDEHKKVNLPDIDKTQTTEESLKEAYLDISNEDEPEPLEAPIPESVLKAEEEAKQADEEKKRAEELSLLHSDNQTSTPPPVTYTEDELNEAKKIADLEGYERAKAECEAGIQKQLASAVEVLGNAMKNVAVANEQVISDIKKSSLDLVLAVCQKAFPSIATRYSFIEVVKTLSDAIDIIKGEERVEIHVSPVLAAKVKEKVDKLKSDMNISCDFVVLSDNNVKINDCKICFDNGNIEKNTDEVMAKIEDIIKSYRDAMKAKTG